MDEQKISDVEKMEIVLRKKEYEENKRKSEKYIPIGSLVNIKNSQKQYMVIGFKFVSHGKEYDYVGVKYPLGYQNETNLFAFDHSDISGIYCLGLHTSEHERLNFGMKKLY